jgi:hypothetical protein
MRRLLPPQSDELQHLIDNLAQAEADRTNAFAEIHDLLETLTAQDLRTTIEGASLQVLPTFEANYVAAMVEYACAKKRIVPPFYLSQVAPLTSPWFASELIGLRLHLLVSSPAPFRQRNLFIDSTLGARV